jgi:hypothetical protein
MRTRQLKHPWPFPESVLGTGERVRNEHTPPKRRKPKKLKPVPPPNTWTQQDLL